MNSDISCSRWTIKRPTMIPLAIFWVCLLASAIIASDSNDPYLFYTHPGAQVSPSGLYGGRLKGKDLRQEVLTCAGSGKALNVTSMSYDPTSRKVLLLLADEDERRVTLASSDPCRERQDHCADALLVDARLPDEQSITKIGPVALYMGQTYFVSRMCYNDTFTMDIRQLTTTRNCKPPNSTFDVLHCSKRIAMHSSRQGCDALPDNPLPLDSLLVAHSAEDELVFLFQVMVSDRLVQLESMSASGKISAIHQSRHDSNLRLSGLTQLGGFSFRPPEHLCWTDIYRVNCARWNPGKHLVNVTTILDPRAVPEVCNSSGTFSADDTLVTTGVTIINTGPSEVYFGCNANTFGQGGAGRIKYNNGKYEVSPLEDDRGQLSAGSLFIAQCPAGVSTGAARFQKNVFFIIFSLVVFSFVMVV